MKSAADIITARTSATQTDIQIPSMPIIDGRIITVPSSKTR